MSNEFIFEDKNYNRLNRATISRFEAIAITIPLDFLIRTIQNISQLSSSLECDLSTIDFVALIGYIHNPNDKSNVLITQEAFTSGLDVENKAESAYNMTKDSSDLTSRDLAFLEQFKIQKPLTLIFGAKYVSLTQEQKSRALISPIITYLYLQYYYLSMITTERQVLELTRDWYDDYNDPKETGWGFKYNFNETFEKMIGNDIETLEYFYDIMVDGRFDDLAEAIDNFGYVLPRIKLIVETIVSNVNYNEFMRRNGGILNLNSI